jgi:hypothetical protein
VIWLLCAAGPALAQKDSADPLDVPRGSGPAAESLAHLSPDARIERAVEAMHQRGHRELPVQAWALLDQARQQASPALAVRAVELAPSNPAVRYEAARQLRSPVELVHALIALGQSFPGLVWVVSLVGGALGVGLCLLAFLVVLVTFARTVGLHGHMLGHLISRTDPPAWPGVLLILMVLVILPLAGIGPALLVAVAATVATLRLGRPQATAVVVVLVLAGVALGPGLQLWSRFAAIQGRDPALAAAWRVEASQPLPGDRQHLEHALVLRPEDLLLRLALASAWLREGEIARVEAVLDQLPPSASADFLARADNLRGTALLARGDIDGAIAAYESGRATRESAALLYNLSQAYGRAVLLPERSALFSAARDLDPELISEYAAFEGANVHRFVIQESPSLLTYLKRGTAPGVEAEKLTDEIRSWSLGPRAPGWAWALLPVGALLATLARRKTIWRCSRCERPVCQSCLPKDAAVGATCVRCARLFTTNASSDPRMRKRQLELDRRRQRLLGTTLAGLALLLPGAGRVAEGRVGAGGMCFFLLGTALGLVAISHLFTAPVELGGFARALPLIAGLLLASPVLLAALLEARNRLANVRTRP